MLGLDYASSSPGAAAVKQAGYGFVARYLSRYTAKTIKKPEYDDMTNNGVGVVLVFEDYANQALKGYAQGVSDAQVALAQANALGWPETRPIHFAVDFDISDAQKPVAGQYMLGVISVLGLARTGAYGGYWWIKYCADNNLAAPNARWQAVAWSGSNIHPSATMFQRLGGVTVNGTSCDVNEALQADFGQNNGEEEMPKITKDQVYFHYMTIFGQPPSEQESANYEGKDYVWATEDMKSYAYNNGLYYGMYKEQTAAQEAELAKQAKDALAAEQKAEAALKALQDQNTQDTATGNAFIRFIGKLFGRGN